MAHTRKFAWVAGTLTALFIWAGCADVAPTGADAGSAEDAGGDRPDTTPSLDSGGGDVDDETADTGEDTPDLIDDDPNLTLCSREGGDACQPVEALDLGEVEPGRGARETLLLSNRGNGDATVEDVQLDAAPIWSISLLDEERATPLSLPLTLESGQDLLIELRLTTQAAPGDHAGALTLTGRAGDTPWRIDATVSARVSACAELRDSCDGDWSNGCEVDLGRDSAHCGRCDQTCEFEGGVGSCVEGRCLAQVCQDDFFGQTCDPCPGLNEQGPCNGRGVCDDGVEGEGTCTCEGGYEGPACDQDVDECRDGTDDCSERTACVNEPGGFSCQCLPGFEGDGQVCLGLNGRPCQDDAQCVETCVEDVCASPSGVGGACDDLADCERGLLCQAARCVQSDGGLCEDNADCQDVCINGACTTPSGTGGRCDTGDDDDCAEDNNTCARGTCLLTLGQRCAGNEECAEVCVASICAALSPTEGPCDEALDCEEDHVCSEDRCRRVTGQACERNAQCVGACISAVCSPISQTRQPCDEANDCVANHACLDGVCLRRDGEACERDNQCTALCFEGTCDVDECVEGRDDCAPTALCENTVGGYTCTCGPDTFGDGVTCEPCRACPADTFQSAACTPESDTACQNCDAACAGCDGPSDADCAACADGYVAQGQRCLLAGPPVASCRAATVALDAQGVATLSPDQIDNGSAAQAGIATREVSPSSFTCDSLGANAVTLSVTDDLDQSDSCEAEVTVVDETPPTARCAAGVSVEVPSGGIAQLNPEQIDDNSDDACGVAQLSVTPSSFTAADVGTRRVTLSVTDASGNEGTCEVDVEVTAEVAECPCEGFVITAVFDGPLAGGTPKGVELTACQAIADASQWGLGSANNGEGSDGQEFTFPNEPVAAGQRVYVVSESTQFTAFFGFAPDHVAGAMSINGDDAVELYFNGQVVDLFGDVNVDGTNQPWEYLDGWAARRDGVAPSPNFDPRLWNFSGPNALDGAPDNLGADSPVPVDAWRSPLACP